MIHTLKKIFGLAPKTDYKKLVQQGAEIIDVRTKSEYLSGHIKDSKNIPLNSLTQNISKLKEKEKIYILCCASGMRSGTAKSILKSFGYTQVFNGGGWQSLQNKIK